MEKFTTLLIKHVQEHFTSALQQIIPNLISLRASTTPLTLTKFQCQNDKFELVGHTDLIVREAFNHQGRTGEDNLPLHFHFHITCEHNVITQSAIDFDLSGLGTMKYEQGVVTNTPLSFPAWKDSLYQEDLEQIQRELNIWGHDEGINEHELQDYYSTQIVNK